MEVGASVEKNGATYYELTSPFSPDGLVRHTTDGRFVALHPATGLDALWYDFGAQQGIWWKAEGRTCLNQGRITQRGLEAVVPAGQFANAIGIELHGACADAGGNKDIFATGAGLVEHEEITIAGPQRYRLREARIDGQIISLAAPAVRLTLSVNKPVYQPDLMPPIEAERAVPTLRAVLRIENTSSQPLRINFPSGQRFDAQILSPSGESLYVWSATRLFAQAASSLELDDSSEEFQVETLLGNSDLREPWPAGRYLLRMWLTTSEEPHYEARIPFEIAEPTY